MAWMSPLLFCASGGLASELPPLPRDDARLATVLFHPTDLPIAPPVVPLNHPNPLGHLTLRFDQLEGQDVYWEARVVHCNKDWQPPGIWERTRRQGFQTGDNFLVLVGGTLRRSRQTASAGPGLRPLQVL